MRSAKYDNVGTELAEPIDPERQEASERFRVIWPFLEAGVPLKRLAKEQGKSLRTLRYWVALYRKGDIPALVSKSRSDRGKRRMREESKALAEALWLREPRRPVSSIHRQVAREARSRGVPVPSYDQVLAVRALDPSLATLSREGTKAHKQKYDLLVRFEVSRPEEIWQADHKHLKVWLSDGKGKPKKPWLTAILDDHSRAICGYYQGFEAPSSQRTALAPRQAIWRKGEPDWPVCGISWFIARAQSAEGVEGFLRHQAAHADTPTTTPWRLTAFGGDPRGSVPLRTAWIRPTAPCSGVP